MNRTTHLPHVNRFYDRVVVVVVFLALASSFSTFRDHTQRRATVGRTPLDERSIRRRHLYLTTHSTHNRQHIYAPDGIRTHNISRRAAEDLRLRPRGHWDRRFYDLGQTKSNIYKILYLPTVTFRQYLQFDYEKCRCKVNRATFAQVLRYDMPELSQCYPY